MKASAMVIWVISKLFNYLNNIAVKIYVKFLWGNIFSILLNIYIETEWLGHVIILHLTFWETSRQFFKADALFYIPKSSVWGSPHPHQYMLSVFFILAILLSVRWYLIAVLVCICLMASDGGHFSRVHWSFAYVL